MMNMLFLYQTVKEIGLQTMTQGYLCWQAKVVQR